MDTHGKHILLRMLVLGIFVLILGIAISQPQNMTKTQCALVAEFIWWIPDYRDVRADKSLIKARVRGIPQVHIDTIHAEIDRIWASGVTQEEAVNNWMKKCTSIES